MNLAAVIYRIAWLPPYILWVILIIALPFVVIYARLLNLKKQTRLPVKKDTLSELSSTEN